MARTARIVIPGLPHHVMHRGNNRRRLFSYPHDYTRMLRYMLDALERVDFGVRVHAYALMANHTHLLVTPARKENLAAFVKSFAQRYAAHRNQQRDGSGKLFEERFRSKPVHDESYLAICHAYLELNPVRAGIETSPADYRWSSYSRWAGTADPAPLVRKLLTPSPWYLHLGRTKAQRASRFARWVEACRIFATEPDDIEEWRHVEDASRPYTRRLARPDGRSAREASPSYGGAPIVEPTDRGRPAKKYTTLENACNISQLQARTCPP